MFLFLVNLKNYLFAKIVYFSLIMKKLYILILASGRGMNYRSFKLKSIRISEVLQYLKLVLVHSVKSWY